MSDRPGLLEAPGEPDPVDLDAEIAEIAGSLNVLNTRLVEVTERAIAEGDRIGNGIHSVGQWLAHRAGLSPGHAKQIVQLTAPVLLIIIDTAVALAVSGKSQTPTTSSFPNA